MARPEAKRTRGTAFPQAEIPEKLYFRIGEVARLLGVAPYVLRFWESEFPQLNPGKGGTGHRLYRRREVEMALEIRRLLYGEGYTIPGARQILQDSVRARESHAVVQPAAAIAAGNAPLRRLRQELQEIAGILSRPVLARQANTGTRTPPGKPRGRLTETPPPLFAQELHK